MRKRTLGSKVGVLIGSNEVWSLWLKPGMDFIMTFCMFQENFGTI